MKLINRFALITLGSLLITTVGGCGKSENATTTTAANAPDPQALSQELGVDLPTQDEADARAAAEVNQENADRIFAELEQEAAEEP